MPPGRPAREAIAGLETRRRRTQTDRRGRRALAARPHRTQGAPAKDSGHTSRDRNAIRLRRSGLPPRHSVILHRRSRIRQARHSGIRLRRSVTPHRAVPGAATAAIHRAAIAAEAAHAAIAAAEARTAPAAATAPALHTVAAAVDGAATGSVRHFRATKAASKAGCNSSLRLGWISLRGLTRR